MDINQLGSIFINKTEKVGSVLNVRAGQLLWANVLEVKGNELLLKIGTHLIEAKAQAYVKQGQQLRLLIQGISPQEIRLKIVNEDNTLLRPEQGIARALGLKTNETMEEIIKQMVRLRLPLSRETVLEFSRLYERLDTVIVPKNTHDLVDNLNSNDRLRVGQEFIGQKPLKLIQLGTWLRTLNIEGDTESLLRLYNFFKGQLDKREEALFFQFLNSRETQILGNYNIYGWSILDNHIYLLTQNQKKSKISPEQCFLAVKITSKAAGSLWFKLSYKNSFLNINISCADEHNEAIVNSEIETLKLALLGAGYQDLKITTKVEAIETVLDFIPGPSPEDINYVNLQI
ncbi:hypothetical protein [Desulfitibacter alkalitolerans]|uniref:hypothetical protein n=1 Tax=Desulfitibacter alkalitolerans TaxID=264641 RepID=UPI0004820E41|nr:hypothetical protein [Desulfitibacter alkalitolerans]